MRTKGPIVIGLVAVAMVVFASAYVVDETEQVVVTQFGRVVGSPKVTPGLYFKVPFIQKTNYFPKNLLTWDGDPGQIPTSEKTYIWVDAFARWRIVDPVKFFQTVNNTVSARGRLDDIIDPAVRNFITSYRLIETVRTSNRAMDTVEEGISEEEKKEELPTYNIATGRGKIMEGVLRQAQPKLDQFGIQLVDVKIKRLNFVEQVRKSVYDRMVAERNQIAQKFRSEGEGEARRILGEKERDLKRITSEAYRTAQEIMGRAIRRRVSPVAALQETPVAAPLPDSVAELLGRYPVLASRRKKAFYKRAYFSMTPQVLEGLLRRSAVRLSGDEKAYAMTDPDTDRSERIWVVALCGEASGVEQLIRGYAGEAGRLKAELCVDGQHDPGIQSLLDRFGFETAGDGDRYLVFRKAL